MRAAIVIPAYNESATVEGVVAGVSQYGIPIVVDDGSGDETAQIARDAGAVVVKLPRNAGYDDAIQKGFEKADSLTVDVIATFDADDQFDPLVLRELLGPIAEGDADLVLGVRDRAPRVSERIFNRYARWRFGVPDILCGLKAYRISLYHSHGYFDRTRSIGTELALSSIRDGCRVRTVRAPVKPRKDKSRLGSSFKANGLVLRAFLFAVVSEIKSSKHYPRTP